MVLNPQNDPMGAAIRDYFENRTCQKLVVSSSLFEDDEMPVPHLFRTFPEMNELERTALLLCRGRVLDVGGGAGCHSIVLQEREGLEVTAIDVSPLSVETMRRRGVTCAEMADFFDFVPSCRFDVVLMLMNGMGIVGKLCRLPDLFLRLDELLSPDGMLLVDSSDLRYVFEDEDGAFDPSEFEGYYGEVDFTMHYGNISGRRFDWLYVDFMTLSQYASAAGFKAEKIREGAHYDYLAKISRSV